MRLHSDHDQHRPDDPDLAAAGRDLLARLPFDHDERDDGQKLRLVMKVALTGPEGADMARLVWRNFVAAIARQETNAFEQQGLLKALFSTLKRRPCWMKSPRMTIAPHGKCSDCCATPGAWMVTPSMLFPRRGCWHGAAPPPPRASARPQPSSRLLLAVQTVRPRNGHPRPKRSLRRRRTGLPSWTNS